MGQFKGKDECSQEKQCLAFINKLQVKNQIPAR